MAAGKRVGSTANTMKILALVARRPDGASTTELAKATGINLSTCFNIARTLTADGYLQWLPERKRYTVGSALSALAHQLTTRTRDLESLRPEMQRIANAYALTVTLWRRCSLTSMELVLVADSETALRIQMPVGQRLPVLFGGMGRLMALQAGLTDAEREAIFRGVQWGRPLAYSTFMAQARQARRRGFGMDEGYTNRAVTAVAVAVPSSTGQMQDAFSATMFLGQHSEAALHALVQELHGLAQAAGEIGT